MPLNLEALDDEPILDRCPNFNGGVKSFPSVATLAPSELAGLINADISVEGRVITRRGSITAATAWAHPLLGLSFFQTDAAVTYNNNLVAVVRDGTAFGHFKIWDGAAWQPPVAVLDMSPTLPVQMVQGSEKLWIAQSGFDLSYWGGGGAAGAGHISLGHAGTNTTAPVKPSIICWHTGRLICAGIPGNPEGVSMSQYFDGTVWDHANWDKGIGDGDGDPIVGLVPWTNFNLVVLKQRSVWLINCNPALADPTTGNITGFPVTCVHRQIGCVAGRSGIQVGADVFFLSDSGVRGVARTLASDQQSAVGPPLSEGMEDFINRINPGAYSASVGFYWRNRWILTCALDSATTPTHLLVWNTLTNSWSGYWTGWTATCFTRRVVGGRPHLCFGQQDGSVTDFLDYILESSEVTATYQDQNVAHPTGIDYATTVISRGFTCGDPDALKTGYFAPLEFNKSTAIVTPSITTDGNDAVAATAIDTNPANVDLDIDLPFDLGAGGILPKSIDLMQYGQWKYLQIQLASTAGKMSLNRMSIAAFLDTWTVQQ